MGFFVPVKWLIGVLLIMAVIFVARMAIRGRRG